jgi:hypothetical protein
VRENVLERGSDELRLFVVWMPMLATDARDEIDAELLMGGDRVRQFWDADRVLGTYLAEIDLGGLGYAGIVWDAFFVFGRDSMWRERPSGLAGSGAPVIAETAELESALLRTGD